MTVMTTQLPPSIPVSVLPELFVSHGSFLEIGGSWPDLGAWQSCCGLEWYDGPTRSEVSEQAVRGDVPIDSSGQPDADWSCCYCDDFAFVLNAI
jgi:hypothetical protein